MIRLRYFLTAVWAGIFLIGGTAFADVAIETSVSSSVVPIGEELSLDIIISNANGPIQKPDFPAIEGFSSYSQGHSQQLSIINGQTTSTSIYSYVLIANSLGKKKIGPFEIRIGGKLYKAAAVDVEVVAESRASSMPPQGPVYSQGVAQAPPPRAMPGGDISGQDIFVKAWLDKDEVFVNEPAILTYTIYTRLSATYKGFEKEPVLTGFWVEDFPPDKNPKRTEQFIGGMRYVVADVRKIAIFPTEAGVFTVDPGVLASTVEVRQQDNFDSFFSSNIFGRRTPMMMAPSFFSQVYAKSLPTDKLTLTAKTLPLTDRPKSFTGAVGNFSIEGSVDKSEVEAGDPITYRVRIRGQGNLNTVQPPLFPKMENFKVYDSSSSSNLSKSRLVVEGEKITETVLVPKKPGQYTIPALEFSYFDLQTKRYKELRTEAVRLTVKPSSNPEPTGSEDVPASPGVEPVEKSDVAVVAKDIRYIKTAVSTSSFVSGAHEDPRVWALGITLFLAGIGLLLAGARRRAGSGDIKIARLRRSHQVARTKLKNAHAFLKKGKHDEFYAELYRAMTGYFADKLGLPGQTVTIEGIQQAAQAAGAPSETVEKVRQFFSELSLRRFGRPANDAAQMDEIYRLADGLITLFEKVRVR